MKKAIRRNESGKKLASRAGARAIVWLLIPILVFILLNADYMPQVPRLTGTSVTEAAEYFRQSTHKVPSSGIEDTIWQQQERLLHDVAKFRAEHDSVVVEAPPSRESSHEMAGKLVGDNRGTESAIWQQQRQLLREIAELRAAHKELLLEVAKLRAAHDLAVQAPPSLPASTHETPGEAVDAPPSPPSIDKTVGEAVHEQPSPPSSDETPGEAVETPPSPASSDETPDKSNDAPPSPASNDETPVGVVDAQPSPPSSDDTHGEAVEAPPSPTSSDETLVVDAKKDVAVPRSKSTCDFSSTRMDICAMEGDVRMHGKAATVYVVSASDDSYRPENGMVTIHPYPRKSETETMQTIREVTIRWNDPPGAYAPRCTVTHDVPAVVFSTGGYLGNFFHAMTDGIIPLFNTVREYNGRVQLVVTDYNHEWVDKFRDILAALSNYPVIDFDADDEVRCFPSVHVGTESHKELGIIPAFSRKGYTMTDFQNFLRSVYSLKREWSTPVNRASGDRPRLAMILRRNSRAFANEAEAIAAATEVGFEVVPAGLEAVSDTARFAEVVNSCDVMVGVHGAGLANLVFLPRNATVLQVVPWGDLRWASFTAIGAPAADMGLRYVEYEAAAEETTLKYVYPRDHAVFTDPRSIQKQGFGVAWGTFFNGQNVTLDINRFRWVLQQIYHDSVLPDPSFDPAPVAEALASGDVDANRDAENEKGLQAINGGVDGSLIKSDVVAPRSKSSCDFRSERMDICTMDGDVRMHGKAATVYVVSASGDSYRPENGTVTIHPYTRKWEPRTMQIVREVTIRWNDPPGPDAPGCTVTHDVPAVVFSSGGYLANFFHAMTDGIIPLFNTAREFDGRVQLVATNYDSKWLAKFKDILAALSNYPVIDFDADDEVRCFPSVRVGTESHKELGIIPALSHKGYTMTDFREFLRSAYSLKREWVTPVNITSGERPRLVMVSRRRSREIANEADAIATATQVGFEVLSAGPEVVSDMARFAEVVNSCDVILGVHGAGLTNLVFLPRNGTVMQIVPWGDMRWASFSAFGAPTADMGLRYVEYEATAEETTLKYIYPRDHAVFTDPRSIQRQGFGVAWETFFNGQNVTLDIDRFRGVMQQIYQSVTIT